MYSTRTEVIILTDEDRTGSAVVVAIPEDQFKHGDEVYVTVYTKRDWEEVRNVKRS